MTVVTIHKAKTQLSQLIARAEAGEEIVIARGAEPVVKLTPVKPAKKKPYFGSHAGQFPDIPDSFWFDPLPEDELRLWEGSDDDPLR
jgi:prevent-host-death family protein